MMELTQMTEVMREETMRALEKLAMMVKVELARAKRKQETVTMMEVMVIIGCIFLNDGKFELDDYD
jgi:hypothetical protein